MRYAIVFLQLIGYSISIYQQRAEFCNKLNGLFQQPLYPYEILPATCKQTCFHFKTRVKKVKSFNSKPRFSALLYNLSDYDSCQVGFDQGFCLKGDCIVENSVKRYTKDIEIFRVDKKELLTVVPSGSKNVLISMHADKHADIIIPGLNRINDEAFHSHTYKHGYDIREHRLQANVGIEYNNQIKNI